MSNSRPLIDLVRDFRASGATIDERIDVLILKGTFDNITTQKAWVDLSALPPPSITSIQVYDPDISGDFGPNDEFDPDRNVNLTIVKPFLSGIGFFFFQDALLKYFTSGVDVAELRVADLQVEDEFRARGLGVTHWVLGEHLTPPPIPTEISPSKLVADYVPDREVPRDLSPWIFQTLPARPSIAFEAWRSISARRLLSGLVSSASLEEGIVYLQVSGPPIFRISAEDPEVTKSWEMLTEVAIWIFLSGSDIEARHRLFGGELARAKRPDQDFVTTLSRAFDAAKVAYDAHVQSASRETLKALADLRKTVIEETQKVSQRAQDMASGLARGLAVSATPFVLKILADVGKITAPEISACFYFVAAIFIIVSFYLTCRINEEYLQGQNESRESWMQTLYTYISSKEREEIAKLPIQRAINSYLKTRKILFLIYCVLATTLIGVGIYTLYNGNQTSSVKTSLQATSRAEMGLAHRPESLASTSKVSGSRPATPQLAPEKGSRIPTGKRGSPLLNSGQQPPESSQAPHATSQGM